LKLFRLDEFLASSHKWWEEFSERMNRLVAYQMPDSRLDEMLGNAFYPQHEPIEEMVTAPGTVTEQVAETSTRRINLYNDVKRFIFHGSGQERPAIQGTAWQAYNGVAEYVDWHLPMRGDDDSGSRMQSAYIGRGSAIKQRALRWLETNTSVRN
jgi:hypothetical protein